jgi:hypothetical protein
MSGALAEAPLLTSQSSYELLWLGQLRLPGLGHPQIQFYLKIDTFGQKRALAPLAGTPELWIFAQGL